MALACRPVTSQAAIHQFEFAATPLTWAQAKRLAPAYFPELWDRRHKERQQEAILKVWQLWFASAGAYGSPAIRSQAEEMSKHLGATIWELPSAGLFAAGETGSTGSKQTLPVPHEEGAERRVG